MSPTQIPYSYFLYIFKYLPSNILLPILPPSNHVPYLASLYTLTEIFDFSTSVFGV
jgi:hypothetical protein